MEKQDLALNSQQWLICLKTKPINLNEYPWCEKAEEHKDHDITTHNWSLWNSLQKTRKREWTNWISGEES